MFQSQLDIFDFFVSQYDYFFGFFFSKQNELMCWTTSYLLEFWFPRNWVCMRFSYNPIPRPHIDKQSGYEQSLVSWSISVQELNCSMIRWLKILNEMKLPIKGNTQTYSTVTDLAKFLGWSRSVPLWHATW